MDNLVPLGLFLLIAGAVVVVGVLISARITSQHRKRLIGSEDPVIPVNLASVNDAVLVARVGGQVTFANEVARRWFSLDSIEPDLWLLARQVTPSNAFLELFATEGQATFQIGDRTVQATSHRVAVGDTAQFIVVLREQTPLPVLDREERGSARALQVLGEIIRTINASLELPATLQATLDGLRPLIQYDAAQICLWDVQSETLRPAARSGPDEYVAATRRDDQVYRRGEGYPGWIALKRQPLLIADAEATDDPPLLHRPPAPPFSSYLGVPLTVRNRFIGTLEVVSTAPDAFDREDQALLELVAEQAAIAIDNAQQFSAQSERVAELSGLQKIAEAISGLQDPRQLFAQLGQRVAELMGTEMAGVLLYDREQERLVAQRPLYGVVDTVAARYIIPLKKGTTARGLWEDVAFWYSNDVAGDHIVAELGLLEIAEMAGVRTTAMAAMTVGEERIGVLQVSNRKDGEPFSMEDIRLLQIYANQAAIIVESARLYSQEQSRVAELQGLQQIAQAMSAFTNPEELYASLTRRIAELLGVDICGVLIYEPDEEKLVARAPFFGVTDEIVSNYSIQVGKRGLAREVWREYELFESNHVFTDNAIDLLGMREVARSAGMRTTLLAPLSAGGRRFGMLQVANKSDGTDFDDNDKRLMAIFAGQAAVLIDNARLYQDTDATLRKRAAELRSVSRISRELNATLELERILEVIAVEAQRAEGARWGNLTMFLHTGTDYIPSMQFGMPLGEEARILEKACARSGETLVIEDFDKVPHYPSPIPGARSALLVPIRFEDRTVGVIGLYSDKPRGLGPSAIEYAQALSSQATIAVTNSTRHQEQMERSELLRRRAEQMSQIFELGRMFRTDQSVESNLTSVARAVAEAAGFDTTLISVLDPAGRILRHVAQRGLPESIFKAISQMEIVWDRISPFLDEKHRMGGAYFVPGTESADLLRALGLPVPPRSETAMIIPDRWNPGDLMLIQLRSTADDLLGVLIVDHPRTGMLPSRDAVELLGIFANQAAIVVENSRLYRSAEERAEELSRSLQNLERSYQELDKLSQEMIRKDVELSQANELLNLRAQRLLALHRIMESVDTTQTPEAVLRDIATSVVQEMDVDQCVLMLGTDPAGNLLHVVAAEGKLPDESSYRNLLKTDGPLSAVYHDQQPVIYSSGGKGGTPTAKLAEALGAHTFAAMPLQIDSRHGVMLVGSTRRGAAFSDDDRDLFTLLASQIVVEYENARLYRAVQDEAAAAASERDRLQQLHLITTALQQARDLHDRLAIIARGIRSVGWNRVAVTLLGKDREVVEFATAGYTQEEEQALLGELLPGDIWERRFDDAEFMSLRLGSCYFLAHDHPWVIAHVPGASAPAADEPSDPARWHPKDQIYLPMYAGTEIIGVLNLREPADGLKPTVNSLRPIELFMQQASSALENIRLYQETLELQSYNEAVVQSIQQGIVVIDASGTIETINAFAREQFGWNEELIGRNLFEAQPTLAGLGLPADLKSVIESGEPVEHTRVQYPVGDEVHVINLFLYPRFDEQESVTGGVLLMEDITQRARLEADIALRGQQLAALNEVSRRITAALSVEAVVRHALDQAHQVINYDHVEVWLRPPDSDTLELRGSRGQGADQDTIGLTVEIDKVHHFSQIARENAPLVLDDAPPPAEAGKGHLRSWMGVPMVSGGTMTGIMVFEKTEAHAYAPADAQVASALANQVAVALDNARLFEEAADRAAELNSRTQRLALLNRISSTLGGSLDQSSILQTVVDELTRAFAADHGCVILFDSERHVGTLTIQSPSNPDGSVDMLSTSLEENPAIEHLMKTRQPISIEDVSSDPLLATMRDDFMRLGIKSSLLVPLIVGNVMIGLITIDEKDRQRKFEPEQVELAQTIVNQAAISVQNAQLFQETVARQHELSILFEAGRIASASLDLETVARNAAEYFVRALHEVEGCFISLLSPDGSALHPLIDFTRIEGIRALSEDDHRLDLSHYPAVTRVITERNTEVISIGSGTASPAEADWLHRKGMGTVLLIPLIARDATIGLVELWDADPDRRISQREIRLARALAASVATAMENARLHDETEQRLDELSLINEVSRALTQIVSLEDLYGMLQEQIGSVLNVRSITLAQRSPLTGQITFLLVVRDGERIEREPIEYGADLYSYVIETWEPLLISHDVDQRLEELGLYALDPGLKSFVAVPFSSGEVVGVLAVEDYEQTHAFSEATLRVLNPIAAQVAVSIENARLYGELEQRLSETTTLQEVSRVVNSALELKQIFERVVSELANAFHYPLIGLFTVEGHEMVLQAHHGYSEEEAAHLARVTVEAGIIGRAATTGEAQFVQDVSRDPDYLVIKDWVRSEIAVPIISDEAVLGVLAVASGADNPLDTNDLQLMRTFAGQVAAAMANARLYQQMVELSADLERRVEERTAELREERDRIDTLYRIAVELTASLDLDRVLNRALELVGEAVGADTGALFLIDPQSDFLIHRASMQYDANLPPGGRQIQLGRHEGLAGWVMDNRQSLVIDNVQLDPRWSNVPGTERRRSLLGAPLVANEEVLGCIFFNSDTVAAFNEKHLRLVEAAANQVAASINNAELYRLIRDQAERLGVMLRNQQTEAAKSQAILESVADGVMVSDQTGVIILFNAAAERILGLRRDLVLGRYTSDLSGLYGPSVDEWEAKLAEWQQHPAEYQGEFLSDQIEVEDRVVSVRVAPVLHGNDYLGLVYVFRDITREVIADRLKSEFVARVSHELRTPMTSIKGYTDLLLLGAAGDLAEQQRRFLETVKSNADRLSLLVNDLIDISRIEQGQLEIDIRPVNLHEIVKQVIDTFEGRKKEEGRTIPIMADIPEDLPEFEADYDRLVQILTNLVSNAYYYTPDEGRVIIRACVEDSGMRIDVEDTGIGIPKDEQPRIFERFFRGESHPLVFRKAGTGLGLSIVQQLVEMHHGRVTFVSEENVGTTFTVWLPLRQGTASQ